MLASNAIAVDTSPMRIRGIVGASLYRSARAAGAPPSAVQDYLRTIDEHMPFEEIAPGVFRATVAAAGADTRFFRLRLINP